MSEHQAKEERTEEGKTLTIKISLEGPAELLSWVRDNTPDKVVGRLAFLLPEDFKKHMRAARREQLLAVRSLLDTAIARTEMEEKPRRQATKVEVK